LWNTEEEDWQITVQTGTGKTVSITAWMYDTIDTIKSKVQKKLDIAITQQMYCLNHKMLPSENALRTSG
jgi:hypothetical protein